MAFLVFAAHSEALDRNCWGPYVSLGEAYRVHKADVHVASSIGPEGMEQKANGEFIILRLRVSNVGHDSATVSASDFHLHGARWNNMGSQPNLLDSNSFPGGFRISTQVTPPSGKGVTWNQSATVSLNDGQTRISMNDNGDAAITNYGQSVSIAPGQTLQLENGESVTYEENGSLRVTAQNGFGGRIESTLTPRGKGVDVDVTAHDVDLGGALVNGYEQRQTSPRPSTVQSRGL